MLGVDGRTSSKSTCIFGVATFSIPGAAQCIGSKVNEGGAESNLPSSPDQSKDYRTRGKRKAA